MRWSVQTTQISAVVILAATTTYCIGVPCVLHHDALNACYLADLVLSNLSVRHQNTVGRSKVVWSAYSFLLCMMYDCNDDVVHACGPRSCQPTVPLVNHSTIEVILYMFHGKWLECLFLWCRAYNVMLQGCISWYGGDVNNSRKTENSSLNDARMRNVLWCV